MNMLATPIRDAEPTAHEVKARLLAARAMLGTGKFRLTYDAAEDVECEVTYWFRPEPHAFEDCKAIAAGTVSECLAAVERYAAERAAPAIAAE
jgi:hypothetical protein